MTIDHRERLLFVCLKRTSFVEDDLALLRERYDVRVFEFGAGPGAPHDAETRAGRAAGTLREAVRQYRWLRRELPQADLVYGWFADYHLALPVWMARQAGVPVAVPLAGFDAIELPALGYGVYHSRWRGPLARRVVRGASLLLPVSETMIATENRYSAYPEPLKNGVRHHVPNLQTPYEVIPFGYDADDWPAGSGTRAPSVLTVGHMSDERTFLRKGGDFLIEAARRMPEVPFEVIGVPEASARVFREKYAPPANFTFSPPRPREALAAAYGEASVYAQLSRAEGHPNVLCEAMCCGAIPVGSDVFGIPETIGTTGEVVETPEPDRVVDALRKALGGATPRQRERVRERITEHYATAQRRDALFAALDQMQQRGGGTS